MYIMFPIGFMYYFGINLDSRFSVPDFWPKKHETHEIPFERDDIREEIERLKQRRLAARARRLAMEEGEEERQGEQVVGENVREVLEGRRRREHLSGTRVVGRREGGEEDGVAVGKDLVEEAKGKGGGWFGWGK